MKKMIIAALVLSSISAFAGTSATLNLKGNVAAVNDISVAADAAAQALGITVGSSALKVATVTETSNDKDGYDIMMSSANGGKLVHTVDTTKDTTYQLSYGAGPMASPTTTPVKVKDITSLTGLTTATSDVKVTVTSAPNAVAGDYTDIVTFSMVAK